MSTDDRVRHRVRGPMMIMGAAMTLIYIGIGAALLLKRSFAVDVPSPFRESLAVMLIIYGLYRGWRVYEDNK